MNDRANTDVLTAQFTPTRRSVVGSIGLLPFAAIAIWMNAISSSPKIIVVDGWVLAESDLL